MQSTRKHLAIGFTLVELLVALALGLIVLLGLTVVFARNSGNHVELERTVRQVEGARFSLDLINEDLLHAGYFGDFNPNRLLPNAPAYQTPDPCATAVGLQGWDTAATPVQIPVAVQGIGPGAALACLSNRRPGTDAIVVRHAETGAPTALAAATANNLYIQISRCSTQLALTPIRAAAGQSATLNLQLPDCATVNPVLRRLTQRTYYVATCNDCIANDGIPTLKRVEMIDGAMRTMSVAEGIENLQVEYGLDTNNDGRPDNFVTLGSGAIATPAVAPNVWQNVVSVRVHLLARATDTTAGYSDVRTYQVGPDVSVSPTDSFKRTLLATTVRLNNVGGRRE